MSDALFADFDKEGKYLYFTASTDAALNIGWLDMSSLGRPVTRSVYAVVLKKDLPSPLAPESDEETPDSKKDEAAKETAGKDQAAGKDKEKGEKPKPPVKVEIDFENIGQRILALPIPARNYQGLSVGKTGELFLVEGPPVDPLDFDEGGPALTLHKFELKTRKVEKILENIGSFFLSLDGEKMLYRQKDQWSIAKAAKPAEGPPKPGEGGPLKLEALEAYVDPRAEWKHMYDEVWRDERDFFYDPGLHGLDLPAVKKRYEPYLDGVASRDDLNYLFEEMLGEMTVGHMFVGGGDRPEVKKVKVGLLGADYRIENGRYRFARVYNGENWNPKLRAPLTQPGVNVVPGEYLLAVNGREVNGSDEVYSFFEATAGKQVVLKVGPHPDGTGSHEVTVVPVEEENGLRNLAWIEANRRKVDEMTGGRVAYVYLPDTYAGGYTNFNRYYFAQVGKEAAIIDERFNGGGRRRRLHHRLPAPSAAELLDDARGPGHHHPDRSHLRAEGHDHQRDGWLRRRRLAMDVPQDRHRPARRQANVGRARRALHQPRRPAGRWLCRHSQPGLLQYQRDMGRREPRRPPGHRGGIRPEGGTRGA